jgi:Domain of unknown function (DUF222)
MRHAPRELAAEDPIELLAVAIDALGVAELQGRFGPELIELDRLRARLDAQISRRVERFDRSLECTLSGHRSAAAWLGEHCRVASIDAHSRVRIARQVRDCAQIRESWEVGRITTRHVEVLARARHAAKADVEFAEFEAAAVAVAETSGPEVLAGTCTRWREALDADRQAADPVNEAEQRFERRGLAASETLGGMVALDGMLDPATGEVVLTALEVAMDQARVNEDPRSLPQLRADALGEICHHFLSHREPGSNKPHVILHSDRQTLSGHGVGLCVTERGTIIDAATARLWACDSIVQHLLMDESVPLALGRAARTFTPAQLRAMAARDLGCRWPGCTQPPSRCQGHHLEWWERDHGDTDLENGVLFCKFHHRQLHTGKYWIELVDDPGGPPAFDVFGPGAVLIGRSRPAARDPIILTRVGHDHERIRARIAELEAFTADRDRKAS